LQQQTESFSFLLKRCFGHLMIIFC
jgi:hypothetical protein